MKKIVNLILIALFACLCTQNVEAQTRIGKEHFIDFGIHYGWAPGRLCNFGGGQIDINSATTNFRVRAEMEGLERYLRSTGHLGWGFSAQVQYLFKIPNTNEVYAYPSFGYAFDFHKSWKRISDFGTGINIGGGVEYQFNDYWSAYFETRFQQRFLSYNRFAFIIGFNYAL